MTAIIDYGAGNIKSVEKAFEFLDFHAFVTSSVDEILNADRVVLPGDGSFGFAMDSLKKSNLIPVIKEVVDKRIPFLGICLGYQLLFKGSEEDGGVEGLGLVEGDVLRFPDTEGFTVPQIGWNDLSITHGKRLYEGIDNGTYVYFVHSYYVDCKEREAVASQTDYIINYDSSIEKGNVFGCQFHPEKSSKKGLNILRNFCRCTRKE